MINNFLSDSQYKIINISTQTFIISNYIEKDISLFLITNKYYNSY